MAIEMKEYAGLQTESEEVRAFYRTLADRLLLMMDRQPDWDYIAFEGP